LGLVVEVPVAHVIAALNVDRDAATVGRSVIPGPGGLVIGNAEMLPVGAGRGAGVSGDGGAGGPRDRTGQPGHLGAVGLEELKGFAHAPERGGISAEFEGAQARRDGHVGHALVLRAVGAHEGDVDDEPGDH
jgi:hypothetical protein